MMLGLAGVVQLWPADKQLVIGEGLETMLAAATRLPYRGAPLRPAWATLSDRRDGAISRHRRRRAADRARRQRPQRRGAGRGGSLQAALAAGWTRRRPAACPIAPAPISTTSFSRSAGARVMNGFTAEEFEPDAGQRHHGEADTAPWHHRKHGNTPGTASARRNTAGRSLAPPPITASPAKSSPRSCRRPRPTRWRCCCSISPISATRSAAGRTTGGERPAFPQPVRAAGGGDGQGAQGPLGRPYPHIFDTADPDWARECITGGMSSGEGSCTPSATRSTP